MEVYITAFVLLFAMAALDVYSGRRDVSRLTLMLGTVLLVLLIGLLLWNNRDSDTPATPTTSGR